MRKIKFNTSSYQKIDKFRTTLRISLLILISLSMIFASLYKISRNRQNLKDKKETLNLIQKKIENLNNRMSKQKSTISQTKKKWKMKIDFINLLLSGGSKPLASRLTTIEEILPGGVYLKDLSYKQTANIEFKITVISTNFSNLFKFYKKLEKFDYRIIDKSESISYIESAA